MDRVLFPIPHWSGSSLPLAEEEGIKVQVRRNTAGGTDAGQIQLSEEGVKVATIAVPCRYIHSPASVMSKEDFEGSIQARKKLSQDGSKKGRQANEDSY
jgi:putative aminopeptidase FrvX